MRPSLHLKLNQQLAMTPQLQQAIRLLQLSSIELELEIKTALETNPLLEPDEIEEESEPKDIGVTSEAQSSEAWDEIDYAQTSLNKKQDYFLLQKSAETTLQQHLHWQMAISSFSERERIIATSLIDAISEEGYLLNSLPEIQEELGDAFLPEEVQAVLTRIQQFDPIGVGARNLAECLNIQLHALSMTTPSLLLEEAKKLATEHLEALGKRDYTHLKSRLNLNEADLTAVIKILTSLDPRPGTQIASKNCEYIIPDVIVRKKNGEWTVELNKEFIPSLRVNPNYAALIQGADTKGDIEMLKEQLKEAKWFLKSLKTRHESLLKVSLCIIERQKDFLEYGEEMMKPLNLQDIATNVHLHESTISRITSQKYILTPRGLFELKFFFSNPLKTVQGNQSATAIRAFIKKLIAQESRLDPLSDLKITQLLSEQGVNIARRTVAKYREAMNIASSSERKSVISER